jgi:hypothetical protein
MLRAFSPTKDPREALQALHEGISDASGKTPADVQPIYESNMKPGATGFRWGPYLDAVAGAVVYETPLAGESKGGVEPIDFAFSLKYLQLRRRDAEKIAERHIKNSDEAHREKMNLLSRMYMRFGEEGVQAAYQKAVGRLPADYPVLASLLIDRGKEELAGRLLNAGAELSVLIGFERTGSIDV